MFVFGYLVLTIVPPNLFALILTLLIDSFIIISVLLYISLYLEFVFDYSFVITAFLLQHQLHSFLIMINFQLMLKFVDCSSRSLYLTILGYHLNGISFLYLDLLVNFGILVAIFSFFCTIDSIFVWFTNSLCSKFSLNWSN